MNALKNTAKLVQVTSLDALLPDGSRVSWQSYRDASAPATDKPTVYFTTLAANPGVAGETTLSLATIGAQAMDHDVELMLTAGTARVTWADGSSVPLPINGSVTLPARGSDKAATLTFAGETCSLKACPRWDLPVVAKMPAAEPPAGSTGAVTEQSRDDNVENPPPPFPGSNR